MSSVDPYQAPTSIEETPDEQPPQSIDELARQTFLAWEKLRIAYVVILVVVTFAVAGLFGSRLLAIAEFWVTSIVGAVFANVAFFAGPVVETYVRWLGYRGEVLRPILFCAGSVIACVLAAFTVGLVSFQTAM